MIYNGDKPYIFISYSHKNTNEVLPIIKRLTDDGYRVWYDEGIDPGTEWDEFIANRVIDCHCMIAMISDEYKKSENCCDELNFARDEDKQRLLIYLKNVVLPSGMRMRLNRLQAIHKYTYQNESDFYRKLYDTDMLAKCKDEVKATVNKPKPPAVEKVVHNEPKHIEPDDSHMLRYNGTRLVGCNKEAKNVVIKEGTTSIIDGAFFECKKLTSIIIPNSVTSIGESAFENCISLTSITIPSGITVIEDDTFSGCINLESVIFSENSKLTSIGSSAFWGCGNLGSVTIPDGVTSIGEDAFSDCRCLKSVKIPNSVTVIGDNAFFKCNLYHIYYGDTRFNWHRIKKGKGFDYDPQYFTIHCTDGDTKIYTFTKNEPEPKPLEPDDSHMVKYEGTKVVGCDKAARSVVIKQGATKICDSAFFYCHSLTSVTIPDSVTSIGGGAFEGCSSLTSVTIPDSVTSIGYSAFKWCSSLTNVTIPNSVKSIGNYAFSHCISLTDIYFKGIKSKWNIIQKRLDWDFDTPKYTVHCTDGDIQK